MGNRLRASRTGVACAAAGTALAVLSLPVGLIEMAVTSVGLSEIMPGAAPPLGWTARLLLAGFAGMMAMGVALAVGRADPFAQGEKTMGFALSRLTAFARGRNRKPDTLDDMPVLRRADAHPDAPARRPIFANSDFGANGMFAEAAPVDDNIQIESDIAGLAMPRSPEPLDDDSVIRAVSMPLDCGQGEDMPLGFAPLAAPVPPPGIDVDAQTPAPSRALPSLEGLSIAELAERFERGLARRNTAAAPPAIVQPPRVLADIPPAAPVPVQADVDADVDQALRDALGTLQRMSAR